MERPTFLLHQKKTKIKQTKTLSSIRSFFSVVYLVFLSLKKTLEFFSNMRWRTDIHIHTSQEKERKRTEENREKKCSDGKKRALK